MRELYIHERLGEYYLVEKGIDDYLVWEHISKSGHLYRSLRKLKVMAAMHNIELIVQ